MWRGHAPGATSLLEVAEVEQYLSLGRMRPQGIRVFRDTQQVEQDQYTIGDGRGSTIVRPERLAGLFASGATIILEAVHLVFPEVARFCTSLGEDLGHPVQVNAYYAPPGSTAFALHHDTHDVFGLQLAGSKTWEVRDPIIELPLRSQPFDPSEMRPGPVVWTGQLDPGDVLYLPRGWLHRAGTNREPSLHLTIGVLVRTWHAELLEAVRVAATTKLELRKSVRSSQVDGVLRLLADELRPPLLESRAKEQRRRANNPPLPDRFADLHSGRELTLATELRRRGEVWMLVVEADGRVALELPEKTILFPVTCGPALKWLVEHESSFTPRDMPGALTDDDRLVVLGRLVREGVVTTQVA
jgi:bifunctional lysine-specific demethylase and histidyl-hydroxylase NO66